MVCVDPDISRLLLFIAVQCAHFKTQKLIHDIFLCSELSCGFCSSFIVIDHEK